jgi:hypothetical protein
MVSGEQSKLPTPAEGSTGGSAETGGAVSQKSKREG